MPTLTASTGVVNLTTSTGWSPAQIPQNGDDLIIGAATLNLDADKTFNIITFNNASSRLDWTGLPRTVVATNGWFLTGNIAANVLFTQSLSSGVLTLKGKWTISAGSGQGRIITITGGTFNLSTANDSQSDVVLEVTGNTLHTLPFLGSGAFNTTGRILYQTTNTAYTAINGWSGGKWTHNSIGLNSFTAGANFSFSLAGTASIDFNGRLEILGGAFPFQLATGHSGLLRFFGDFVATGLSQNRVVVMNSTSSTVEWWGYIESNVYITFQGSGTTIWRNATVTIPAGRFLRFAQTLNLLSNVAITNAGVIAFEGGITSVGDPCTITHSNINAITYVNSSILNGKILPFQLSSPTLPSVQNVTVGVTYGYTGFLQTGTALQLDPAILASAISANIPDIVDGVHEADTRDYDDIPGSIGWEFKKLRQTNPLIEFEVTDDITPTDTEFAVNITETHDDGSFEDSVLYFADGPLAYDNNAILSLQKLTGYSVITLQRPLRIAPTVGSKGIIDPLSHVHSVEAIQEGLALESTSQEILTAIGDIPTTIDPADIDTIREGLALEDTSQEILTSIGNIVIDFTPIEEAIESSTSEILAAIAEEDDPTNIINLVISIKDQNDLAVSGVIISVQGTSLSSVTGTNGSAVIKLTRNANYNLRFITPPGYSSINDVQINVVLSDITLQYTISKTSVPPLGPELCALDVFIKSQGTNSVSAISGVKLTANLSECYIINNDIMHLNTVQSATTDSSGYAELILIRGQSYNLEINSPESYYQETISITIPDAPSATLSQVIE